MIPTQPASLGRYEIRRELGRGMMGVVYEAHDTLLGRPVALKVIQLAFAVGEDDRRSFETRFLAEARTAARLSHPGIVVVHDAGRDESGALYMALELLRGRTLDAVLKERGALPWRDALKIAQRAAEALHHAHAQGVVHRDIKPANIMLLSPGEPKIMDFGIARVETSQLTAAGQFLGTPLYMSPEQAMAHPVDARSDLFSLGAVLYEMLTGRQAFAGESVTKILFQVMSREPEPPTLVARDAPPAVDYLLARSLAKDVARRHPDGQTLADDIEDVLAGREPRARAGWQAVVVTGTVVAASAAAPTFVPAATAVGPAERMPPHASRPGAPTGTPLPQPAARRTASAAGPPRPAAVPSAGNRSSTSSLVIVGTTCAVLGAGVFWFRSPGTAPSPSPVARRLDTQPSAPARAAQEQVPSSPQSEPAATGRAASADAETPPDSAAPARLFFALEHSLKSGRVRVWVDEQPVLEETLDSRVTRDVAGVIKFRKGELSEALEVSSGRREVRVQVAWDDNVKTQSIYANFKPGSTRRLKAKLGSLGGLKKDLSLDWQ
jgi:serine/threonine-protein kinase